MTDRTGVPPEVFDAEFERLLDFGRHSPQADGGAAWLDEDGRPDPTRPIFTWITARMTHVYALGHLRGRAGDAELAVRGLRGLNGRLRDHIHGGWFDSVADDGTTPDLKGCYAHAFVVLAASSATVAGLPGGPDLLADALQVWIGRFFDEADGMFVDAYSRDFGRLDPYRGANANMHAVEALLAAADVLDDQSLRARAISVAHRMAVEFAKPHGWRLPEHYDATWRPRLDYHRDRPADPFQPYGATVGHALEWSRLLLHLEAATETDPPWMLEAATALFDRAVDDGWHVDGAPGFVYTTDWSGRPVVHDRMHWVLAEALAAAAVLHRRTGDPRYPQLIAQWWDYAEHVVIDRRRGSWHHQLDQENRPIATVWPGKPDLYHAAQAMLIPQLPLAPTLAVALRADGHP